MTKNTSLFWDKKIRSERKLLEADPMTRERINIAYSFFSRKPNQKVLDIGAGYGFIEELLSKNRNIRIYGNDISALAIKDLKKRFKGVFKKESIYRMEYQKNFFDAIFALEVLEHVPASKIASLFKKTREIIKNNGLFIISVPVNEGLALKKDNPNAHMREYTEEIIREELSRAKFDVVRVETLVAFKKLYCLKKTLSKFLKNKWKPNNLVILAKPV